MNSVFIIKTCYYEQIFQKICAAGAPFVTGDAYDGTEVGGNAG